MVICEDRTPMKHSVCFASWRLNEENHTTHKFPFDGLYLSMAALGAEEGRDPPLHRF